jgi:Tol biopolymer transport system component
MRKKYAFSLLIVGFIFACSNNEQRIEGCFPSDKLPAHITPLTNFGQRSEWSLDGKEIFFVDRAGGDVWVVDVATKKTRQITKPEDRPEGHGYYRVLVLANGDLLLGIGPKRQQMYFQVLDKDLKNPPQNIEGVELCEGPAVSRKTMKIAWTLPGQFQIHMGELSYSSGKPEIINKKALLDVKDMGTVDSVEYEFIIETQNWRPPLEEELILSQYRKGNGFFKSEVFGLNTKTGELINYSKSRSTYDEPEGIFPDGEYTLTECDRHRPTKRSSTIEVYKLKLDTTSVENERLVFFSDVEGFRSSNPVVRDDGKFFVFQASEASSDAGVGCGLYLFDIEQYERAKKTGKI